MLTSRLGRRANGGPWQLLARVRRRLPSGTQQPASR